MKYFRVFGVLVGILLLAYVCHRVNWSMVRDSMALLGWGYLLVLASALAWDWVNTIGFEKAFRESSLKMPFIKLFEIRIVGETFNALLPSGYIGGEPLKAKFLS